MIKTDFWSDEKLSTISRDARLTFIGLWTFSDDVGIVKGNIKWLMNNIFPYDDVNLMQFQKWIDELINLKIIMPYKSNSESFIYIKNFNKHQTINHPTVSYNPLPTKVELREYYGSGKVTLPPNINKSKVNKIEDNVRESFELFWEAYQYKTGSKEKLIQKWDSIPESERAKIMIHVPKYVLSTPDKQFRKHPSTYLNNESWKDEIINSNGYEKPVGREPTAEEIELRDYPFGRPNK